MDSEVDPLDSILRLDNDNGSNAESVLENPFGAATINPNKDNDRRLFQECRTKFSWDSKLPYGQQPNPIDRPTPLLFPDHFLQVEGGVVVIYWEKERSVPCTCSIISVDEVAKTFLFRVYGWHGKTRKTFFDTGRDVEANESKV